MHRLLFVLHFSYTNNHQSNNNSETGGFMKYTILSALLCVATVSCYGSSELKNTPMKFNLEYLERPGLPTEDTPRPEGYPVYIGPIYQDREETERLYIINKNMFRYQPEKVVYREVKSSQIYTEEGLKFGLVICQPYSPLTKEKESRLTPLCRTDDLKIRGVSDVIDGTLTPSRLVIKYLEQCQENDGK